jgi:hypothetical protein
VKESISSAADDGRKSKHATPRPVAETREMLLVELLGWPRWVLLGATGGRVSWPGNLGNRSLHICSGTNQARAYGKLTVRRK